MLWTAQNGGFGGFGTLQIVVRIYRVSEPILTTGAQNGDFGVSRVAFMCMSMLGHVVHLRKQWFRGFRGPLR